MKKALACSLLWCWLLAFPVFGEAPANLVTEPTYGKKYPPAPATEKHQYVPELLEPQVLSEKDLPDGEEDGVKRPPGKDLFIDLDENFTAKDDAIEDEEAFLPAPGGLK